MTSKLHWLKMTGRVLCLAMLMVDCNCVNFQFSDEELKKKVEALEASQDEVKEKVEELEKQLRARSADNNKLNEENDELEALKASRDETERKIKGLEKLLGQLQAQLKEQLKAQFDTLNAELKKLQTLISTEENERNKALGMERKKREEELEDVRKTLVLLQERLEKIEQKFQGLQPNPGPQANSTTSSTGPKTSPNTPAANPGLQTNSTTSNTGPKTSPNAPAANPGSQTNSTTSNTGSQPNTPGAQSSAEADSLQKIDDILNNIVDPNFSKGVYTLINKVEQGKLKDSQDISRALSSLRPKQKGKGGVIITNEKIKKKNEVLNKLNDYLQKILSKKGS